MALITLTTDFGLRDPDLGYLKSRILQAIPQADLVDISHTSLPFDPEEAIYIIKNALSEFPQGSFHLIGIDSENSTDNPPILVRTERHYYLGNDNGILPAALAGQTYKVYQLELKPYDSFLNAQIQAVGQLVKRAEPEDFAVATERFKQIKLAKPLIRYDEKSKKAALITTKVIYNDNYGNAVFNLSRQEFEELRAGRSFSIKLQHYEIYNINNGYSPQKNTGVITSAGTMFARFNRFGYLEIFIYKSNALTGGADTLLGLKKNKIINIVFEG